MHLAIEDLLQKYSPSASPILEQAGVYINAQFREKNALSGKMKRNNFGLNAGLTNKGVE